MQRFHFNMARHPKLTPMLTAAVLNAAITGIKDLPQYHTLDYDLNLSFANGKTIHAANALANGGAQELFNEVGVPISAAADNPFERVDLSRLSGTIRVLPRVREARLLSVTCPRTKFRPGETAKIYVGYRPFRAAESILQIDFKVPRDLPDGTYPLAIMDWQTYVQEQQQNRPFRFTAQSSDEVFAVLKDVMSLRHNAVYVELQQKPDGVAIGRTAMPHFPSSRRQVLIDAGESDTTEFVTSSLQVVPTDLVMDGAATFNLTIDREATVDTPAPRESKPPLEVKPPPHVAPAPAHPREAAPKPHAPARGAAPSPGSGAGGSAPSTRPAGAATVASHQPRGQSGA
jgi:hypothetical protein